MKCLKKYIIKEMARYTCGWTHDLLTQSEAFTKSTFQNHIVREIVAVILLNAKISNCIQNVQCGRLQDILVVEKRL